MVEGVTMAVRRKNLAVPVDVADFRRELDRDTASQREVTLAGEQTLASEMGCDERRRTRRLYIDTRPLEVEDVGHPGGEKVFVVARMSKQEHPDRID